MTPLSSWGRLEAPLHYAVPLSREKASEQISGPPFPGIAYGMGRSYGDICLNPRGTAWQTTDLNNFISFDDKSGLLRCEAGLLLKDIQKVVVPRGWMLPVTPGTQLITVGGAIANDVHGKNHHRFGTFGDHVQYLRLVRTDSQIVECSTTKNKDWLAATVGGMGLTGVVLEVEIKLRAVDGPWLETETLPYHSLEEFFELADSSEAHWENTVSWIDCLGGRQGRGIFMRGNPTTASPDFPPQSKQLNMPFVPPVSLINKLSLKPFNTAYFYLQTRKAGRGISHYQPFFYPLDNIRNWNRMYGPKGFYQYQSVIPRINGLDATRAMLDAIQRSGEGSFLAVLKTFGKRPAAGMMSFPMHGVTLALDFPNKGPHTHQLFKQLDAIVQEAGGRIYPAKDARMPKELFESGYSRLDEFLQYRDLGISSGLSRRLIGS
ncbi:FAD-binding oxidoreductase [Marinobacter sp. HL-58]|uniref:FAD-binding oxidoreductase n=1 Tax=Marinobacter sp. HL-58 TaxID=1479237 RepID=UPI000486B01E|nr:FAD-binding oxidoreductase [Marinobacter sp. HL-58]KPQ01357.1 MAG: FAD/FMN-containing dehydrogenase [Marinobacter sp. HL-58]